uniref:Uncharacterized protein n=1 Tax=Timema douglasi TaxID=61478 RepID=A0A7R8VVH1_TIMDO|nr:unnamed protein product [Timema douglasi]
MSIRKKVGVCLVGCKHPNGRLYLTNILRNLCKYSLFQKEMVGGKGRPIRRGKFWTKTRTSASCLESNRFTCTSV